jgi:hypothetical protein
MALTPEIMPRDALRRTLGRLPGDVLRNTGPRRGRCFELSFKVISDNPPDMDLVLVHGRGRPSPDHPFVDHAWIAWAALIYDPVVDAYFSTDIFERQNDVRIAAIYSRAEAVERLLACGTYGPWNAKGGSDG